MNILLKDIDSVAVPISEEIPKPSVDFENSLKKELEELKTSLDSITHFNKAKVTEYMNGV